MNLLFVNTVHQSIAVKVKESVGLYRPKVLQCVGDFSGHPSALPHQSATEVTRGSMLFYSVSWLPLGAAPSCGNSRAHPRANT